MVAALLGTGEWYVSCSKSVLLCCSKSGLDLSLWVGEPVLVVCLLL